MNAIPKSVNSTRDTTREAEFESIFLEHWSRIYQIIFQLVGDPAEAEDIALETFWRLWKHTPAQKNLGGWLYRVAINLGYNALRSRHRRTVYEERARPDHDSDPEAKVEQDEQRSRVQQILKGMPPRESQLLILKHSGLSYKEIAETLGLSVNSIGSLLLRAEEGFEKRFSKDALLKF
jgi:RNA polymerase sigma-70 factor (ECF subfamily)